jgi:hypothetical protein
MPRSAEAQARASDEIHDRSRHQHFAGPRQRRDAAADVDDHAVGHAGDHVAFTGVQAQPDGRVRSARFGADRASAPNRAGRTVEDHEDPAVADSHGVAAEARGLLDDQTTQALERRRRARVASPLPTARQLDAQERQGCVSARTSRIAGTSAGRSSTASCGKRLDIMKPTIACGRLRTHEASVSIA